MEVLDSSFKVKMTRVKVKVTKLSQKVKEVSHRQKKKRLFQSERLVHAFPTLLSIPWSLASEREKIGFSVMTLKI